MSVLDRWMVVQMASPDPSTWHVLDGAYKLRRTALDKGEMHMRGGLVAVQAITLGDYLRKLESQYRFWFRDQRACVLCGRPAVHQHTMEEWSDYAETQEYEAHEDQRIQDEMRNG